jgi:hypothetical protein
MVKKQPKEDEKIEGTAQRDVVLTDITRLYVARKVASRHTKATNELKGDVTKLSFATLSKALRVWMEANPNERDLVLPNGGHVVLGEKNSLTSMDDTLATFYSDFQKKHHQKQVSKEEIDAFISELHEERNNKRKMTSTLSYVEPE